MDHMKKLAPVCLALTLFGCSETQKLDTMRDSTVEMNGTTKELLGTTKEMNTTTKSLAASTDDLKERTAKMEQRTGELNNTTKSMAQETHEMNSTTKELAATSKDLNTNTKDLNATTKNLAETSNDMRDRMARMEKSTDELKKLTENLKNQSAEIYDASRQAVAMNSRRDLLESVYKAESGGQKAVFAALYFKAFEFQFWTGADKDASEDRRLSLMADATKEFFKAVQEFGDADPSAEPDPIAQRDAKSPLRSAANKQATFNALALTMHESNSKQEDMLKDRKGLKLVTMYSLITDGLAAEKSSSQQDLPEYQKVVLENKELALKLLQARHNILLAVFLKDTLNKSIVAAGGADEAKPSVTASIKNMFNKLISEGKAAANIYLQPKTTGNPYIWEVNLDQYNLQQTLLLNLYLRGCMQARTALSDVGVKPVIHAHLATIIKGAKITGGTKSAGDLQNAQNQLRETMEKVRASSEVAAPAAEAPAPAATPQTAH